MSKTYYYIDHTALLEQDFYLIAEELIARGDVQFLLDASVYDRINEYRRLARTADALALENLVNFFCAATNAMQVDTAECFDPTPFADMAGALCVVTQHRHPALRFAALGGGVTYYRVEDGALVPFSGEAGQNGRAFYLENDTYVTPVDIDEIDYVFSPRYGYLRLDRSREYSGGEGACYRTYNGFFAKLYFKKHQTYVNFKKLQTMVEMGCSTPFISWPRDVLYHNDQFVGYLMDELTDTRSVDELRDDGFSGFSLLDRFLIVRNFLRCVSYLHERRILVGDMKLDNILVGPNADVYIIDAGSFQIEDYACDVCHKEYTERIYTGDQLKRILRSEQEEYFPINKIIFEILMLKGPFYSRDNTEIDGDGARNFSYPLSFDPTAEDPRALPYHMKVWFSLSALMRQYFYYYFTQGKVTELSDWLRELDVYILSKRRPAKEE